MGDMNWMESMASEALAGQILDANRYTRQYGLELHKEDTELLIRERADVLKKERRVEFGAGILPKIIYAFCDSDYISQEDYCDTLVRLQEIFYLYKNEMMDEITDDELLEFMKEQFEGACFGDLDYLEGTCLDLFALGFRAGYRGYTKSAGKGEVGKFEIAERWVRELYLEVLRDLCWR